MHDLDLPTYLMRAWPIISTRTRPGVCDRSPAFLGQRLAQFHSPLVERIDPPEEALNDRPVLVD